MMITKQINVKANMLDIDSLVRRIEVDLRQLKESAIRQGCLNPDADIAARDTRITRHAWEDSAKSAETERAV